MILEPLSAFANQCHGDGNQNTKKRRANGKNANTKQTKKIFSVSGKDFSP